MRVSSDLLTGGLLYIMKAILYSTKQILFLTIVIFQLFVLQAHNHLIFKLFYLIFFCFHANNFSPFPNCFY